MRDFKGIKRQRGRNRNGGGGGGGGKPQHNTNRAFDSNGPEGVKVRGAAQHVYEKYQQLARDAHTAGDRVLAENHLQHAEHYFRVMRAMQPQRPLSEIIGRDQFVSGYDIDFEDESGAGDNGESDSDVGEGSEISAERAEPRQNEPRQNEYRQGEYRNGEQRPREDRPREDRFQSDRSQNDRFARNGRDDRPRDERPRDDRPRDDRPREDRQRFNRDDRPRFERQEREAAGRPEREAGHRPDRDSQNRSDTRPEREPLSVVEPETTPLTQAPAASVLRADDGEVSHAPAFLQVRPVEPRDDAGGEPRRVRAPRRRPAPRTFDGGDDAPAIADAEEV